MAVEDEGQRRRVRPALLIIAISLLLVGFVWLWWAGVPILYRGVNDITPGEHLKAITDTRTALLAGLAALGALGTFWLNGRAQRFTAASLRFTAESVRLAEENLRLTKSSQEESFRLAERGHLTDRYSKAIEQLGSDKLDVRLGGIYALEQLATDSESTRDQATIVEVLSAFVRMHSDPLYQCKVVLPEQSIDGEPDKWQEKAAEHLRVRPEWFPIDVQAAVTVLVRLPQVKGVMRADLRGTWLSHMDFREANLAGVRLDRAQLRGSSFARANLRGANLSNAEMELAALLEADLTGAVLSLAKLSSLRLRGADLTNADLTGAHFGPNPEFEKLNEVAAGEEEPAIKRYSYLGVSFEDVNLTGTNLSGVDLTTARDLTQSQIDSAFGSEYTELPKGLQRPEGWRNKHAGDAPDLRRAPTVAAPPLHPSDPSTHGAHA